MFHENRGENSIEKQMTQSTFSKVGLSYGTVMRSLEVVSECHEILTSICLWGWGAGTLGRGTVFWPSR